MPGVVIVIIVLILSRYILDAPLETEENKAGYNWHDILHLGWGLLFLAYYLQGSMAGGRHDSLIRRFEISPLDHYPVFILQGYYPAVFAFWERHVISRGNATP